nr:acyltransferase family protein [Enterovibrio norvegicus]
MHHRNTSLDFLKLILSAFVVALHADFLIDYSPILNHFTVQGLFRVAVPTFFIISGYHFINVTNIDQLYIWCKRIFLLYIIWLLIYAPFWFSTISHDFNGLKRMFFLFITGYHHLWYLPAMIGSGCLAFYFRGNVFLGSLASAILFIVGVVIQYVGNYKLVLSHSIFFDLDVNFLHRNFALFGFPFFYFGYLISYYGIPFRLKKSTVYLLLCLALTAYFFEVFINYFGASVGGFDNYLMLFFLCPILFVFFCQVEINVGFGKAVSLLAAGVYFVHPYAIWFFGKIAEGRETVFSIYAFVFSMFLSIFIVKINNKVRCIL